MKRKVQNLYAFTHTLGDFFILNLSYLFGYYFSFRSSFFLQDTKYLQLGLYLNVIYLFSAQFSGTLSIERSTRFTETLSSLIRLFFFQIVLTFSYIVVFKDLNETFLLSREVLLVTYTSAAILITTWRFSLVKLVRFYRSKGYNNRSVLVVGAGKTAQSFKHMLSYKTEYGLQCIGFFDNHPERYEPSVKNDIKGNVADAKKYLLHHSVDELFCTLSYSEEETIKDLVDFCDKNCIRFRMVPELNEFMTHHLNKVQIDYYGPIPVMTLRPEPLENWANRFVKRFFDIIFSIGTLLFLLSWLMPIIALLIKITSKGPVFFIQERSGLKNSIFKVIKFRTMYINPYADVKQTEWNDERITPIGKFLRKTSLDELPQFINVFLGHMSVIGPRPHMLRHTEEYASIIDKFMVRHLIKPGITGWAQVNGCRGITKTHEAMEKRVHADVWYIENWSIALDLRILWMTLYNIISGEESAF